MNTQKVISILLLLAFATPFHVFAQQQGSIITQEQRKAIQDAKDDAQSCFNWHSKGNALLWMALGCALPGISILGAYASNPTIPVDKLIGKSPEYISFYSDTYRHQIQGQSVGVAFAGSVVSIVFLGLAFTAFQDQGSQSDACILPVSVYVTNNR